MKLQMDFILYCTDGVGIINSDRDNPVCGDWYKSELLLPAVGF